MILVSAGTVGIPFVRLMEAALMAAKALPHQQFIVQTGVTQVTGDIPGNMEVRAYVPFSQMLTFYRTAEVVVMAGGEASVLTALTYIKRPLVIVPRLKRFAEHVDDQQLEMANYIAARTDSVVVEDTASLVSIIRHVLGMSRIHATTRATENQVLINELIRCCESGV